MKLFILLIALTTSLSSFACSCDETPEHEFHIQYFSELKGIPVSDIELIGYKEKFQFHLLPYLAVKYSTASYSDQCLLDCGNYGTRFVTKVRYAGSCIAKIVTPALSAEKDYDENSEIFKVKRDTCK